MKIAELHRYPLKSGAAETLTQTPVLETGFPDDRRWLLVDEQGRFLSQREHAAMARIQTRVAESLQFLYEGRSLTLERSFARHPLRSVTVWGDQLEAWDLGDAPAAFFSGILQRNVRLCEATPVPSRRVNEIHSEGRTVPFLFADSFPYLVISQESLDLLHEKLDAAGHAAVGMERFRPNIVIQGWRPHAEDTVQTLNIGGHVRLRLSRPCSRCNIINVDQLTGTAAGPEPLRTLARYRKAGGKVNFGMHAWLLSGAGSVIRKGDVVTLEA